MGRFKPHLIRDDDVVDFWAAVDVRGGNDCWEWKGRVNSTGHGIYSFRGYLTTTGRFAWFASGGWSHPHYRRIFHACDNLICCNPAHLRTSKYKKWPDLDVP